MTTESNNPTATSKKMNKDHLEWKKESDKRKTLWIVVTMLFLFTAFFQGALYVLQGTLNIILICLILGMMVIGTVLKFRYQNFQKSKPDTD